MLVIAGGQPTSGLFFFIPIMGYLSEKREAVKMDVALYFSHYSLPFWEKPENPYGFYEPSIIKGWTFMEGGDGRVFPAETHFMLPVLNGLYRLELPGVMAHVSFILDFKEKTIISPLQTWVQITTEAKEKDEKGVSVVVKDGFVQVKSLWGRENRTENSFDFLESHQKLQGDPRTEEFWADFFLKRLREKKAIAYEKAKKALAEAELFRCIPDIDDSIGTNQQD
jgi:hypothetical protein